MTRQKVQAGRNWYAVHTYAGYEDAVVRNLKQRIESLGMEDKIFSAVVPTEKKIKIVGGKRKLLKKEYTRVMFWWIWSSRIILGM